MDLTVNLFTSFGYFAHEAEHVVALREMVATVRPGGWFVIDFLNPATVRARLVPCERSALQGREVEVTRSLSPDGHYVSKTIARKAGPSSSGCGCSSRTRSRRCSRRAGDHRPPAIRRLRRLAHAGRVAAYHPGGPDGMTLRLVPTPLGGPDSAARAARGRRGSRRCSTPSCRRRRATRSWQRLRQPGALAVTSGQQPGLFTGPLYTVHKALSTAALARVLERRWNRPVVPIFWSAGDDHDFAEASQAAWIRADGALATASLPPRPSDAPLTPMYRQPLGEAVVPALEALLGDLPPSEFRDVPSEWLRRHYRPDATVGGAFAGAMAELLAPAGILVYDSTHPVGQARGRAAA